MTGGLFSFLGDVRWLGETNLGQRLGRTVAGGDYGGFIARAEPQVATVLATRLTHVVHEPRQVQVGGMSLESFQVDNQPRPPQFFGFPPIRHCVLPLPYG